LNFPQKPHILIINKLLQPYDILGDGLFVNAVMSVLTKTPRDHHSFKGVGTCGEHIRKFSYLCNPYGLKGLPQFNYQTPYTFFNSSDVTHRVSNVDYQELYYLNYDAYICNAFSMFDLFNNNIRLVGRGGVYVKTERPFDQYKFSIEDVNKIRIEYNYFSNLFKEVHGDVLALKLLEAEFKSISSNTHFREEVIRNVLCKEKGVSIFF